MKNPITCYPTTPYNINCSSWAPEFTLGFLWGSCLSLSLDFCVILVFCLTFWPFSCGQCIIFTHIYCFWLPLRYLLSFFMWSLYYFYSHLLLLITPSVPFVLFHVIIIIFTHIDCFWLPLRYLLSFFMWSLYYSYSHLLLLITPSVPFVLFHVVIVLFLLTFTASDYYPFGIFNHCTYMWTALALSHNFTKRWGP